MIVILWFYYRIRNYYGCIFKEIVLELIFLSKEIEFDGIIFKDFIDINRIRV